MSSCHSPVPMANPLLGMNVFFLDSHLREEEGGGEKAQGRNQGFQKLVAVSGESFCTSVLLRTLSHVGCELWRGKRRNCPACVSGIWPTLECHCFSLAGVHPEWLFLIWKLISWVVLTFQTGCVTWKWVFLLNFTGTEFAACSASLQQRQAGVVVQIPLGGDTLLSVWPELSETLKTSCWQQSLLKMWHPGTVASSMGRLMAKWVSWVWLL